MGQAVPEIPLSIGSKLELLLRAFVFAKFPYTSPYTHAFVCVCILPCIYVYIILAIHTTEALRVCTLAPSFIAVFIFYESLNYNVYVYSDRYMWIYVLNTRQLRLIYCGIILLTQQKWLTSTELFTEYTQLGSSLTLSSYSF